MPPRPPIPEGLHVIYLKLPISNAGKVPAGSICISGILKKSNPLFYRGSIGKGVNRI
jgi:hypothetical protein